MFYCMTSTSTPSYSQVPSQDLLFLAYSSFSFPLNAVAQKPVPSPISLSYLSHFHILYTVLMTLYFLCFSLFLSLPLTPQSKYFLYSAILYTQLTPPLSIPSIFPCSLNFSEITFFPTLAH